MEPLVNIRNYVLSRAVYPIFRSLTVGSAVTDRQHVLDPLSVIVTLATNSFKPVGTKLSVTDCKILLHDVSMLQGTVRTLCGDAKTNVKILHFPIIHACRQFAKCWADDEGVVFLFQKARAGLANLWHTYSDDRDTKACINTYMNIMASTLQNGKRSIDMLDMLVRLDVADMTGIAPSIDEAERAVVPSDIVDVRKNIYDKLHKVWDANKLVIIVSLIRELEGSPQPSRQHLFDATDAFMSVIHMRCKQIIDSIYEQNDKPW